jgi:hypothetical protein
MLGAQGRTKNSTCKKWSIIFMDVATTITVVSTAVSAAAAVVSTVAAVVIVRLTNKTLPVYQKQLEIGQEQIRAAQNQTFNQARPILLPPTNITSTPGDKYLHD